MSLLESEGLLGDELYLNSGRMIDDYNLVILLSIAMAIALEHFSINIGMIAIGFGPIIGAFILGLTPLILIAMWTTKLFFYSFT